MIDATAPSAREPADAGLVVEGLAVAYRTPRGLLHVLQGIDLVIPPASVVGLVGESGSGKSTLAYAVLRHLAGNARVLAGRVLFEDRDLLTAPPAALREVRGTRIGMVFQDPATALNPTLRLGPQLLEGLRRHAGLSGRAAEARGVELLEMVHLPNPRAMLRRFPHEVSGGEKQRVLIAMALACRPSLLVFDEPTTALDATTAAGILDLVRSLQEQTRVAALYITHDLGNVARVAQRVSVAYAGRIVEEGEVEAVLRHPRHPYTRMLMASVPNPYHGGGTRRRLVTFSGLPPDLHDPPPGCIFAARCPFAEPRCRAEPVTLPREGVHRTACLRVEEVAGRPLPSAASRERPAAPGTSSSAPLLETRRLRVVYGRDGVVDTFLGLPSRRVQAVAGVDLVVEAGRTVGLVGESGCGKSTLARALLGLVPFQGTVRLDGRGFASPAHMTREYRRAVQIVFQHPDLSLNPRMTVAEIVGRPLRLYEGLSGAALGRRVVALLDDVRLPEGYARRRPHELSGGEKQRVAVARAFGPRPRLVICDEITSGLDVSVQASLLNLLGDLQDEHGTAFLFISHDLNVVQHFADAVVVMYLGRVVEQRRRVTRMMRPPYHPYTEALLSAVPVPEPSLRVRRVRLEGALPNPSSPPAGCCFSTRCPRRIGEICDREGPPLVEADPDHRLACHMPMDELRAVAPIWQRPGTTFEPE